MEGNGKCEGRPLKRPCTIEKFHGEGGPSEQLQIPYLDAQWQRSPVQGKSYTPLPPPQQKQIELAFKNGEQNVTIGESIFCFKSMTQKPISSASAAGGGDTAAVANHVSFNIRRWTRKENHPPFWAHMNEEQRKNGMLVEVQPGTPEWNLVKNKLFAKKSLTSETHILFSVERVQNIPLIIRYRAEREIQKIKGHVNEIEGVWHGTGINDPKIVVLSRQGFELPNGRTGQPPGFYGDGIYFAKDPCYSNKYAHSVVEPGETGRQPKHLRKMVIGNILPGHSKVFEIDIKQDLTLRMLAQQGFDSVLGGPHQPTQRGPGENASYMYVLYSSSQTCPTHVVGYFDRNIFISKLVNALNHAEKAAGNNPTAFSAWFKASNIENTVYNKTIAVNPSSFAEYLKRIYDEVDSLLNLWQNLYYGLSGGGSSSSSSSSTSSAAPAAPAAAAAAAAPAAAAAAAAPAPAAAAAPTGSSNTARIRHTCVCRNAYKNESDLKKHMRHCSHSGKKVMTLSGLSQNHPQISYMGQYTWDEQHKDGRPTYRGGRDKDACMHYDEKNRLWVIGPFVSNGCSLCAYARDASGRDAFTPDEVTTQWFVHDGLHVNRCLKVISPMSTDSIHVDMSPASGMSADCFLSPMFGHYQKLSRPKNARACYIGEGKRTAVWYLENHWYIGPASNFGSKHAPIVAQSNADTPDAVSPGNWKVLMYNPNNKVRCKLKTTTSI